MKYKIREMFYSLQGEGCNTELPVVFVRFSGCNLRCPWCDTDFSTYTEYTAEQIVNSAIQLNAKARYVILTGGEPSLQVDDELINALHNAGYKIAIETNGTRPLPEKIDWITCSPKEGSKLYLQQADEVKVVYTGINPEHWKKEINSANWLLQPLARDKQTNANEVIQYILDHPQWRLSVQTHKFLGLR
jgi:organic radical activating enzyme